MTLRSLLALVLLLTIPFGCSDGTNDGADCSDESPPNQTSAPSTALIRVSSNIEMRAKYDATGTRQDDSVVTVSMVDLSTIDIESRFPQPCCGSISCFNLTGSLNETCRGAPGGQCGANTCGDKEVCVDGTCVACARRGVSADSVTVSGLPGGDLTLKGTPTNDVFIAENPPAQLFGSTPLVFKFKGRNETGYIESFEHSIEPPTPLEITNPDPTGNFRVGSADLELKWKKGNGDWLEVSIRSSDPTITDKVVCLARDDGCATVPAGAFDLTKQTMKPDDRILMTVVRVKSAVKTLSSDSVASSVKASSRVDMSLEQ